MTDDTGPTPPNILLIVMDTARAMSFSCYGYGKATTPNIDAIAREGTLFEHAISPAPWTIPSHASLFTGLYPTEHQTTSKNPNLAPEHLTIARMLKDRGYRTAGFTNNPFISPKRGFAKGFEHFEEIYLGNDNRFFKEGTFDIQAFHHNAKEKGLHHYVDLCRHLLTSGSIVKNLVNLYIVTLRGNPVALYFGDDGAARTNRRVMEWIGSSGDRPFFIFVNYMECHTPYQPPFSYRDKKMMLWRDLMISQDSNAYCFGQQSITPSQFTRLCELYDLELKYLDAQVGALCRFLQDSGLLDDTLLIITSDHGENIGEHRLFGHILSLYNTVLHVPLVVRYPGVFGAGARVPGLVQTHDIFKTIADITGVAGIRGYSLLDAPTPSREIYSELYGLDHIIDLAAMQERYPHLDMKSFDFGMRCIIGDEYKFIRRTDGSSRELYHYRDDYRETDDLSAALPQKCRTLEERLALAVSRMANRAGLKTRIKRISTGSKRRI